MNRLKWLLAVPVVAVVVVSGGTYGYIHFINGDQPKKLSISDPIPSTSVAPPAPGSVDGTWKVGAGSQAGYRIKEVLFGQSAEAVGRTSDVTGQFALSGTTVSSGSFTVDLTSVHSSESRRDGQFRGRIMDVARYPTATFKTIQPVKLPSLGDDGSVVKATVTGALTIKDVTKTVIIGVQAQRVGTSIRIAGSTDLVFADWHIDNPSGGPARTENHGLLEFLLVFSR